MAFRMSRISWMMLACVAFALGCAKTTDVPAAGGDERVRESFVALQAALKARDADKLWPLLDDESRADAERAAKAVQETYAKADAAEKAEQEKALGLAGPELAGLTGKGFLKTKRFHGKYEELSQSTIDKITVQGDQATVAYTEPDGDKEKLTFVRQGGQWRASLAMPKGT